MQCMQIKDAGIKIENEKQTKQKSVKSLLLKHFLCELIFNYLKLNDLFS